MSSSSSPSSPTTQPFSRNPLPVQKLDIRAILPTRGHEDDAGLDLYVIGTHDFYVGEGKDVPTGIAVELPVGTWGMLVGRSSTIRTHELLVNTAIIDRGYRGELFIHVTNIGRFQRSIPHGTRLAQIILMPNETELVEPEWRDSLTPHKRGNNGFGSTGL